jgi:hypothetical protein
LDLSFRAYSKARIWPQMSKEISGLACHAARRRRRLSGIAFEV